MTTSMREQANDLPGRTGITVVLGALAAVFASAVLFAFSPTLNPLDLLTGRFLEVTVPDVRTMTQQRALVQLSSDRLEGDVDFAYDAEAQLGTVIRQDPLPGSSANRDSTVKLTVSRGPAFLPVPNVVGVSRDDAVNQLQTIDLVVDVTEIVDESAPANTVISTDPTAGVVVQGGSTVRIVVSKGPEVRVIPDLSGIPLEGGAFLLGRAGLNLGTVTRQDNADVPKGAIIAMSPPPGTEVTRDTAIDLTISDGRPPAAVPNVVGKSQAEAAKQLSNAGFVVGEVAEIGGVDDPEAGKVRAQTPAAGTLVRPGEVVTVTVRRSSPPPTTAPPSVAPTTVAPPPTPAPPAPEGQG